jgi:hypothetical protein
LKHELGKTGRFTGPPVPAVQRHTSADSIGNGSIGNGSIGGSGGGSQGKTLQANHGSLGDYTELLGNSVGKLGIISFVETSML